jgi:hypothetical protein
MKHKAWQSFLHFRENDRGLAIFLVMTVFYMFVLPCLGSPGIVNRFMIDIFLSLLLITGIAAILVDKRFFVMVTAIVIIALVFRWAGFFSTSPVLHVLGYLATITSIILFCIFVLTRVLMKGPITLRRIEGAIAAYLLLGLAWTYAYKLVEYLNPGSFTGSISESGGFSSWTYFSFVTLATLGYGDISPVHPVARSLATAEAITGQLYLAILIARLVSQELYYRTSKEGEVK